MSSTKFFVTNQVSQWCHEESIGTETSKNENRRRVFVIYGTETTLHKLTTKKSKSFTCTVDGATSSILQGHTARATPSGVLWTPSDTPRKACGTQSHSSLAWPHLLASDVPNSRPCSRHPGNACGGRHQGTFSAPRESADERNCTNHPRPHTRPPR